MIEWLTDRLRNIRYGLENFWAYAGVIWRDRDWDHYFLFVLMERKLRRMSALEANHGHHVNSDRSARELLTAAVLCKRLAEDRYSDPLYALHERKWGKLKTNFTKIAGGSRIDFSRPNADTPEREELERRESRALYKHERYLQHQDLDYLGTLFKKHALTWWD